jgi:AraC-like DNA-binding protein
MKNRQLKACAAASVAFAIMGFAFLALRPSLQIWPETSGRWQAVPYTGTASGIPSRTLQFESGSRTLKGSFTLGADPAMRVAGIIFSPTTRTPQSFQDFSMYDRIVLSYSTRPDSRFSFLLMQDIAGYSRAGDAISNRFAYLPIMPDQKKRRETFALKNFYTPAWWFELNPTAPNISEVPDFSRLSGIEILVDGKAPSLKEQSIEISEFRFEGSYLPALLCFFCVVFLWVAYFLFFRHRDAGPILIDPPVPLEPPRWQPLKFSSRDGEDFERLSGLIAGSYTMPGLSLETVCSELGIAEERVSRILVKKTGLRFKPYINKVRIGEAARLLAQSDKTATEIAYLVGYSSLGHFNRVFKEITGTTPISFRMESGGAKPPVQ